MRVTLKCKMFQLVMVFSFLCTAQSANILGVFFIPSLSHQVVYQPIWRQLSLRGHQVTVLTPNPLKQTELTNLTEIDTSFAYDVFRRDDISQKMSKNNFMISTVMWIFNVMGEILEGNFKLSDDLIRNRKKEFDLIVVETLHPLAYSYACRFKVPVVGISALGVFLNSHDAVGNPTHPALNPDPLLSFSGELGLIQKATSILHNVWYRFFYYWYFLPKSDKIAKKYFGNDCPYLGDIERNVSLMLLNTNPILHQIRPNVPAVIELGLMNNIEKKPLPHDLQTFLDRSTQGVIYVNLGSNIKIADLEENVRKTMISALSDLPYNVLLKWESEYFPDQPKNIMTQKWFPQRDVLGHPNIKAFVTQGGIQALEEAVANGVPIIGMPFFADQPLNVVKAVKMGIAQSIDYATMTRESLKKVIIDVAETQKYKNEVIELKEILSDQPMTGLEKAVWWIEYALRHKGAQHLRSPAADTPWYEYFLLDVAAAVLVLLSILVFVIVIFLIVFLILSFILVKKYIWNKKFKTKVN